MSSIELDALPVAIIGGGPVGLAAAAHLAVRNIPVKLYEAGPAVASNMRDWGHIRVFTPWKYCIDAIAAGLLAKGGWTSPPSDVFPTGNELIRDYLEPLSNTPELASAVEVNAKVMAVTRLGIDKVVSRGREVRPFVLNVSTPNGNRRDLARVVIDASGTWATPNPLGAGGLPAEGEARHADRIAYGIPDIRVMDRSIYAGGATLVVGAGHSAANVLLDLAAMADDGDTNTLHWVTRSTNLARVYGGGEADGLQARAELGAKLRRLVENGAVSLTSGFSILTIREADGRLFIDGETVHGPQTIGPVDRIIAATGQRPDLSLTRELRLELDPWLESVKALGPLIDPNEHSCGSVPPHGYRELSHLEPGFFTLGIKSYGRAPTFLLLTGYEQARSVAAAIAGDMAAAESVELVLPETGVCSTSFTVEPNGGAACYSEPQPAATACRPEPKPDAEQKGKGCCGTAA